VHALLGQNGAGKSTLVKIIVGALKPDAGTIRLDGKEVSFASSAQAVRAGISVVSQELTLFEDLDVLANLFTMREIRRGPFVSRREMSRRARPVLDELGLSVSDRTPVRELSLAERQLVEIARALLTEPRVLVLDEPTSALESASTERLFEILRVLRERQVAVVFVSHILEEVLSLCDEVTVLRDGRPVLSAAKRADVDVHVLVAAMLGSEQARRLDAGEPGAKTSPPPAAELTEIELGVASAQGELRLEGVFLGERLKDVSLQAGAGEVVGVAGVAGSGHLAVLEVVAGLRRPDAGTVLLPGSGRVPRGLRRAIRSGVALVTGDRRRFGLMLDKPIWENIAQVRAVSMAADGALVRAGRLRERAQVHADRLDVRSASVEERAGQLSGGNQQKVVFAKWLDAHPSVFLLDDPTRGVDVGAKAEMHGLIRAAADDGAVILMCSTDLGELASVCELSGEALQRLAIAEAMHTGSPPPATAAA